MAQRLKNTLQFTDLAPGASVVLPHDLHTSLFRPLAPDIIFLPNPGLAVTSDKINVTVTNEDSVPLSGAILVEAWHTIERSFNDVNDEDLPVKPFIVVSAESANEPSQPPFVPENDVFIFVRPTGVDSTDPSIADGTLAKPYRTVQFAIRVPPSFIPAGTTFRIDCTGIGSELFPQNYSFPVFVGSQSIGQIDFSQRFFHYYNSVNIQAEPQLATGVTGATTIPAPTSINPPPADDLSELISVTLLGAGWTPGQLKGKFLIGAGTAVEHSVIWNNTADTIFLTRKMPGGMNPPLTFPAQIMQPSAAFHAPRDSAEIHEAAINMNNTSMALLGIRVFGDGDPTPVQPFPDWGLQVGGTQPPTALQLCQLVMPGFTQESWVRARQCYMESTNFLTTNLLLTQCYLRKSAETVVFGPGAVTTFWNARTLDNLIRQCVLENMTPINFRDVFDLFDFETIPALVIQNTKILDPVADFIIGGRNEGIIWAGSQLRLLNVDIRRTAPIAPSPSDIPIHIVPGNGNSAAVQLTSVSPAASNFSQPGVVNEDGGHVRAVVTSPTPTTIAGVAGAYKTGSLIAVAAWGIVAFNEADFAGAAAEGSRTSGV